MPNDSCENYRDRVLDIADEFKPGAWMLSVAKVLLPSRTNPTFTLGEAVDELRLWADRARAESWEDRGNRNSLYRDIEATSAALGPRLRSHLDDLLPNLHEGVDRRAAGKAAAAFGERWHRTDSIRSAFRDLCEAAATETCGTADLKPMADILASQLGEPFGHASLGASSRALFKTPFQLELNFWLGKEATIDDLTPQTRLRAAERLLTHSIEEGLVIMWLLYRHAQIDGRITAGSVTLVDAEWAIREAKRTEAGAFEEQEELRGVQECQIWFNEESLFDDDIDREPYVLARVDLGHRPLDGAEEEAIRRIDALLNIVVGAGGSSWTYTGVCVARVDNRLQATSISADPRGEHYPYDAHGTHKTSELLEYWTNRLGHALSVSELPDFLVEALQAFREASTMNRGDGHPSSKHIVTSRIATALEDHTVELVASLAGLTPERLVSALEIMEIGHEWQRLIYDSLLAPLARNLESPELAQEVEAIRLETSESGANGEQFLVLKKLWEKREQLRVLPVSPAERVSFERSLTLISSADNEINSRKYVRKSVALARMRHRRVRNAITHGNPVTSAAINSVRGFSERTARAAIGFALEAFATGETFRELLTTWESQRVALDEKIAAGASMLDRANP